MAEGSLLQRFGAMADKPDDDEEEKLKHRFMLLTATAMSFGGIVWSTLSAFLGVPLPGLIPFAYTVITVVNLTVLARTKNFIVARTVQVLISLLLPFLFQWALGGFVSSGCMMAWAILSLVAALSYESLKGAGIWLVLFLVLTAVSGALEGHLFVPPVLRHANTATYAFALNIGTVASTVFALTYYFRYIRHAAIQELQAKNREIEAGQAALIQSEKMAALGQLVAGVAHELNTPLGAIRASASNLSTALGHAIDELPGLLNRISEAEHRQWSDLVALGRGPARTLGSSEERKEKRRIARALDALGIADAEDAADTLVELGVADVEAFLVLLRSPHGVPLLEGAFNVTSLHRNTENIRIAAERAAKIVFALKSYAHPGGGGERSEGSLAENLDTVLTLYSNLFKRGVEVVRDYDDVGTVVGRHDELNQVWTNLVHNALQAMGYSGTLTLKLRAEGDSVRCSVIDTGPGIPPDVQARIFEPFFTTKPKGEGTGLGLSICRDIVERHGGTLDVETQPGRTSFVATLPRRPLP